MVNLGYVLNVIEDPTERAKTLLDAFRLVSRCLIVAVRVERALSEADEFGDGCVTRSGSFQKIYAQSEFREYLEQQLKVRPYMAALGVAYVFKDQELEATYLTNRALRRRTNYRQQLLEQFGKDRIACRFLKEARELGRFPIETEFKSFPKLVDRFGSKDRIERIATSLLDPASLEASQQAKRDDLLLYMSMVRLQGLQPPPYRTLPAEVRADIKMLWSSYKSAQNDSYEFLLQLGDPERVKSACRAAGVGKQLPEQLYVHRSAEEQLPLLLRVVVYAAKQIVGDVEYDLVRIAHDGRAVAFLKYSAFDEDPHPALEYSLKVYLPKARHGFRDYRDSENPPILHRKESVVDSLYSLYSQFAELTRQEEESGLLSRPDIGYKKQWELLLKETGYRVEAHRLVRLKP